jgi:hypothetical protein
MLHDFPNEAIPDKYSRHFLRSLVFSRSAIYCDDSPTKRTRPSILHFGMVIVGLDYGHAGQMTLDEITVVLRTALRRSPALMARVCRLRTS